MEKLQPSVFVLLPAFAFSLTTQQLRTEKQKLKVRKGERENIRVPAGLVNCADR